MKQKAQNNPEDTGNDSNEAKMNQERRVWIWKTWHIAARHAMPYKFNPNASPRAPARAATSAKDLSSLGLGDLDMIIACSNFPPLELKLLYSKQVLKFDRQLSWRKEWQNNGN